VKSPYIPGKVHTCTSDVECSDGQAAVTSEAIALEYFSSATKGAADDHQQRP